ncbi:hypothetical protein D4764_11G0005250 [Takifugu flavidus]|uniref:Uncharacterized protein n=1 Tax=Takifugu flavidus TaxID=433684 RepID=A0A5C6PF40_9TELE|nr:hypothetical protein D4764_11G0005250 [Takifugu flavidus]
MASCLAELHLWSTKSSLKVKAHHPSSSSSQGPYLSSDPSVDRRDRPVADNTDIGTYQYYDKGEPEVDPASSVLLWGTPAAKTLPALSTQPGAEKTAIGLATFMLRVTRP